MKEKIEVLKNGKSFQKYGSTGIKTIAKIFIFPAKEERF